MALEVSEFSGVRVVKGEKVPLFDGQPSVVHSTTGSKVLGDATIAIAIRGDGTIEWENGEIETFTAGGEIHRGVRGGTTIVIA